MICRVQIMQCSSAVINKNEMEKQTHAYLSACINSLTNQDKGKYPYDFF